MATKRQELRDMLVARLDGRFGERSSDARQAIEKEVDALLQSHSRKLTQDELRHVERKVDRTTRRLQERDEERAKKKQMGIDKKSAPVDESKVSIPLDNYLVFNAAQEIQYQREQLQRKKDIRNKQIEMKRALDAQVGDSKNKDNTAQEIETKYAEHCAKVHQEWQQDEKNSLVQKRQRNMRIKSERDVQLKRNQDRRRRYQEMVSKEEQIMITRAKEELQKEEDRRRQQILDQKMYMVKVQQENKVQKELRRLEKIKEQEEDKMLQKLYAEKLMEQERIRKETFEKMKEKSSNNQKMYILATEEKNRQEKEDEDRALMYQRQKIEQDEIKGENERKRLLRNKIMMNQTLAEQVNEFNSKKTRDQDAEAKFAVTFRAEAEKALADEEKAARARRQRALKHKKELEDQIRLKANMPRDTDSSTMTEFEKQINRASMLKLCEDEEIVQAISHRVRRHNKMMQRGLKEPVERYDGLY